MSDYPRALRLPLAFFVVFAANFACALHAAPIGVQLTTSEKQQLQREARLVVDLLQNHHYSGRAFREIDNKEMVGRFLDELDPGADFLTADDVEFIHRRFDRTLKSVYLFRGDLQPAFEIFDLFAERANSRFAWIYRRLARDFDLNREDSYHDPHQPKAAAAGLSSDERWERRLQDMLLTEMVAGRSADEAREKVQERCDEIARQISATDSFVIRERFFDSVIRAFDPHSGYFSADSAREFAVQMENALVGVGLELRKENGLCVVSSVEPGGPADLHSSLGPGDTVTALAQGDGPWSDASSKRMREIAAFLRGEAGSKLRIAYQAEGTTDRVEVSLSRARVTLANDRAHGAVSSVPDPTGHSRPVGWIVLPSFYASGDGSNTTSAARDLRELLDQMGAEKIEGLVLDLRGNPGGALTEALAVSQLFLSRGTILFSRGVGGILTEHSLKEEAPAYTGPLVILTSSQSASASEIFAGAMKFHRRAVVIGAASTFGKGTSQAYISLAKVPGIDRRDAEAWGTLRLTAERFYLPDGRAVQRAGITSQIVLPDFAPPGSESEAQLAHALPEESITPSAAPPTNAPLESSVSDDLVQAMRERAAHDFKDLPEWDLWHREQQYRRELFERETRSLRLENRRKEWTEMLAQFQTMQRLRRSLASTAAFPTRPIESALVQSAYAAHETKLRKLENGVGQPVLQRLWHGGFFVETDQHHWRELRLTSIAYTAFYGDAETLATAFSDGAKHPVTAANIQGMLQTISLLKHKTDSALLAAANGAAGGTLSPLESRKGIEALLLRLTELDGEMGRERASLDVPLRESLRLAAAWAQWRADRPGP